jgi:hypothetical protein
MIIFISISAINSTHADQIIEKQNSEQIETPIWNINDYWSYEGQFRFENTNMTMSLIATELVLKVSDIFENSYILDVTGQANGKIILKDGGIIDPLVGDIQGKISINKIDLSIDKIHNLTISGMAKKGLITTPIKVNIAQILFSNSFKLINFPLFVGKDWISPESDIQIEGDITVDESNTESIESPDNLTIPSFSFLCKDKKLVYLNNFGINLTSYEIVQQDNNTLSLLYSPNVSNLIRLSCNNLNLNNSKISLNLNLTDSSYIEKPKLSLEIVKPAKQSLILMNKEIENKRLLKTFIFGRVDIEAKITGSLGQVTVRFYIDDNLITELTDSPYKYTFKEHMIGNYELKIIANDEYGREVEETTTAFFLII